MDRSASAAFDFGAVVLVACPLLLLLFNRTTARVVIARASCKLR
jgi:hypothetical protein